MLSQQLNFVASLHHGNLTLSLQMFKFSLKSVTLVKSVRVALDSLPLTFPKDSYLIQGDPSVEEKAYVCQLCSFKLLPPCMWRWRLYSAYHPSTVGPMSRSRVEEQPAGGWKELPNPSMWVVRYNCDLELRSSVSWLECQLQESNRVRALGVSDLGRGHLARACLDQQGLWENLGFCAWLSSSFWDKCEILIHRKPSSACSHLEFWCCHLYHPRMYRNVCSTLVWNGIL